MPGRIVEVSNDRRHLSVQRGFMLVHSTGEDAQEIGRVALDDIAALIANAHGLSHTLNLLLALAQSDAPLVLSGATMLCSTKATASYALQPRVPWWPPACTPASAFITATTATPCASSTALWSPFGL